MATKSEIRFPIYRAVHPGEILSEELKERKIKQKDFAQAIGMSPSHLNEILRAKRTLSATVAYRIETVLGIPAVELLNMQNQFNYETRHLQQQQTNFQITVTQPRKRSSGGQSSFASL